MYCESITDLQTLSPPQIVPKDVLSSNSYNLVYLTVYRPTNYQAAQKYIHFLLISIITYV